MSAISGSSPSTSGLVQASVGPVSGINYQNLIAALTASQQRQVTDLQNNIQSIQAKQAGYSSLEANLTPLAAIIQTLGQASTFQAFQVQTSDPTQLSATANTQATAGSYQFQTLQLASNQATLSKGFANTNQQTLGTGTLTISSGGGLASPTLLSALNGGQGVQLGKIRITDQAGHAATIDLSNAYTVDDVVNAINNNGAALVTASTAGGHLVLSDSSGGSGTLSVTDVSGGRTADDLGIAQSTATGTITGQDVYQLSSGTLLSQINDGNGIRTIAGAPAIQFTLSDGTNLEVKLDGSATVGDVLNDINNATGNGGKLVASLNGNGIRLTDNSGGAGAFTVADDNGASVVGALGLSGVAASGNTITGTSILSGIDSVLLRNLKGGQGISQTGVISLQDRAGLTAQVDLSGAESLDQVLNAINNARTTGGQKLHLTAQIDSAGDGIEVSDTSGSTSANLSIQDVGGSTLAAQLGISVNSAVNSVDSGRLNLQYVNQSTSLAHYAPGGGAVGLGSFAITDSAGHRAVIDVSNATKNLGDLIQSINATAGIQVHAQLNSTGDGFSLIDTAGGAGQLTVSAVSGTSASDLRILGTGTPNGGGQSEIDSRLATVVDITSQDTLDSLVQKIGQSGTVSASVFNDGSPFAPNHLALTANVAGQAGRFFVDQSGIDLGLTTTTAAQNALLRVGAGASGIIKSSSTNQFNDALPGIDVRVLSVGQSPDTVTVSADTSSLATNIQNFVTNYNNFNSQYQTLTKFDTTTETGAALEGSPTALRAKSQLSSLITQVDGAAGSSVQSLVDLGITFNADGSLALDNTKLQHALSNNLSDVTKFFTTATTGFSAVAGAALTAITDPATGTFASANNTLQNSITAYQNRITELNSILTTQEQQLAQSFANLEAFISQMQSQQQQIALIAPLATSSSSSSTSSGSLVK